MTPAARIVVSPFGQARVRAARAFLESRPGISGGPGTGSRPSSSPALLIGGTREAADELVVDLAAESGSSFGIHRFSWTQLAAHLSAPRIAGSGLAPATRLASEAVTARVAFEANEGGRLPRLSSVCRFPGFARALASTLVELRMAAATPETVAESLGEDGNEDGTELAHLLEVYETAMRDAGLADRAALFAAATEEARTHVAFHSIPVLLFDVPIRSVLEARLVGALIDSGGDLLATIPEGDTPTLDRLLDRLHRLPETPVEIERPDRASERGLDRLAHHLFSDVLPEECEWDESVDLFSAPGEGRECVEIARRVLELSASGIPLDEMAIFVRSPETYTPLIETALRRASIPAYFARGTRRPDPAGRAFLAIIACKSEGLSARRFAEYLSFSQVPRLEDGAPPAAIESWVPPSDELIGPAVAAGLRAGSSTGPAPVQLSLFAVPISEGDTDAADLADADTEPDTEPDTDHVPALEGDLRAPWKWEEYLVEAAVIGGHDRWKRRVLGLERELSLKLERASRQDPEAPRVRRLERDLVNLRHLRRFALPVIDTLDTLPREATWGEWLSTLSTLAPRVLRTPERVQAALAELEPMASIGPVGIAEVREVLTERLSTLEKDPPRRRYGRLFVAPPDQARGRSFRVVFTPGLAERIFPQHPREDPLLLDRLRHRLSPTDTDESAGPRGAHLADRFVEKLATQESRAQDERLQLRLAIGAASERAAISFPRLDVVQARPRVPSFYCLEVARATRGLLPDFKELERDAADSAEARLAWPAPANPSKAIDPVEHDLSVLGGLLGSTTSVTGRARYLLELNPHMARGLRARFSRFTWRSWYPHDGLVRATDPLKPILEQHRLIERPYSITALERFSVCPYRFLLSAIHRLEPRADAASPVRLDPLTRGQIIHKMQAEALQRLQEENNLPITPENLTRAEQVLVDSVAEVAAEFREELAPAIYRVWEDEMAEIRADLQIWIRRMSKDAGWTPIHFELAFGLPTDVAGDRDAASIGDPVELHGGWKLRGAIDMVERGADKALRVTDHKTGRNRTKVGMVVGGGEILQPVLYALVVEAMTGDRVVESRLSFSTSRGGFTDHTVALNDFARHYGQAVLERIDNAVKNAFMPPAPSRDACQRCDFRAVCGPSEEMRARRKPQPPLQGLYDLRGLP